MEQEIFVEGMKCEGCASTVKEKFEAIDGVETVSMDVEDKKAVVVSDSVLNKDAFAAALADTNYSVVEE